MIHDPAMAVHMVQLTYFDLDNLFKSTGLLAIVTGEEITPCSWDQIKTLMPSFCLELIHDKLLVGYSL